MSTLGFFGTFWGLFIEGFFFLLLASAFGIWIRQFHFLCARIGEWCVDRPVVGLVAFVFACLDSGWKR